MTNTKLLVVGIFALLLSYTTNAEANPLNKSNSNPLNISASYLDEDSSYQTAALQFLPRYQGAYTSRNQETSSKDKVTVTCSSKGGVTKGTNQTCSGPISGVSNCYSRCWCSDAYKQYTAADKGAGKPCDSLADPCTENGTTYYKTCVRKNCNAIDKTYIAENDKNGVGGFYEFIATNVSGQDGKCYTCSCPANWRTDYYVNNAEKWDTCSSSAQCSGGPKYRITKCVNGYKLVNAFTPQNATCEPCAKGEYSTGSVTCVKCPYGTYADGTGTSTCKTCPAGWTTADAKILGATSKETACKQCPIGTYKSASGSGACTACPAAKPSSPLGSTSESDCVSTCTKNSCKDSPIQKTSKTTLAVLQQSDSHISSVAECIPSCSGDNHGYTVTDCSGGYKVNAAGSGCTAYTAAELCDIHNSLCTGSKYSWEYYFANKALTCLLPKPAAN